MQLLPGFQALALQLQEAAMMGHNDVRNRLSDAVSTAGGHYVDHTGDGESGDVIYHDFKAGGMKKAPYTLADIGGKKAASIDGDKVKSVTPTTSYDEQADDADQYSTMMEAAKRYTSTPVYERFIPQAERDKADGGSFAGKGKSFPILKAGDVAAAVHAMGRAGSYNYGPAQLKANIIRIAKAKGFDGELPDAWKSGDDTKEAARELDITGEVIPLKEGAVGQDGSAYLKLIAPGWGSSAYYPESVLASEGAKTFPKGTKNFWNHQTDLEERERPEGDLRDLASVLTEDAHYEKTGPAGPGLYARAKVMEQFRQAVDDLAPHIGVSIRATGKAKEGKMEGRTGPILEGFSRGISADYVTTPGAGGKVLQLFEAARQRPTPLKESGEPEDMAAAEDLRKLQESNSRMARRLALSEAREMISGKLADIRLPKATVAKLTESLTNSVPINADGELDRKAFDVLIEAGLKAEAEYLREVTGGAHVEGLGAAPAASLTEAQTAELEKEHKREVKRLAERVGLTTKMGKRVFAEGRAAFDPSYNAMNDRVPVTAGAGLED